MIHNVPTCPFRAHFAPHRTYLLCQSVSAQQQVERALLSVPDPVRRLRPLITKAQVELGVYEALFGRAFPTPPSPRLCLIPS